MAAIAARQIEAARPGAVRHRGPAPMVEREVHPVVQPLAVFAAGRRSFDVLVRALVPKTEALAMVFALLPMEENGWRFDETDIVRAGTRYGFPIWRVSRT